MKKPLVSIVRYERPLESARKAIELCGGFNHIPAGAKVFIKPNICFWHKGGLFPKWGVITTSRIVEDVIILLKEIGIYDIAIGEGMVLTHHQDTATPADAFDKLGYNILAEKYGIKVLNVHEREFKKVELGAGIKLNFNADILNSDFVVNIPVLKTHMQTVVSLGIKNMKGMIDIASRKKCHSADAEKDLNYMVARLANKIPLSVTILDGIYTNEIGPSFDGNIRRSNILIASSDVLSADMVGAKVLGHEPDNVPHLAHAASDRKRAADLSTLEIVGENITDVASFHEFALPYNEDGTLPENVHRAGVQGLTCPRYDSSICTYCATILPLFNQVIIHAWRGEAWPDVEILFGKKMKPTPGKAKTVLIGQCMYNANKNNPDIKELIAANGCPPKAGDIVEALKKAGIEVNPFIFEILSSSAVLLLQKYAGDPDFDESFFRVGR